jgi:translation initiation factor 2B subunit (eIF-2B alpha/beta/delta family)
MRLKDKIDNIKEVKKADYLAHAHRWGIFPLLYLLEEYEQSENYEECHLILEVVQQKSDQLRKENSSNISIPTHIRNVAENIKRKYLSPNIKEQVKIIKKTQQECQATAK